MLKPLGWKLYSRALGLYDREDALWVDHGFGLYVGL